MSLTGISKLERFFRKEGGLDIDKNDVARIYDFTNKLIHRFLTEGIENASINGRDVIWISDLPLTDGLKNAMKEYDRLDQSIELSSILESMTKLPPLKYEVGEDIQEELPRIAGGIVVAFIKVFKIIEPKKKNPQTEDWKKISAIFTTLL